MAAPALTTGVREALDVDPAAYYLRPLRQRADQNVTHADWKLDQVRTRLERGDSFEDAVYGMQREYVDQQRTTLLEGDFRSWLGLNRRTPSPRQR